MRNKRLLMLALMLVLLFSLEVPATGSSMVHLVDYKIDGVIALDKQAGHLCNTGAQMDQKIDGKGYMVKYANIYMQKSFIQVLDNNDWITSADVIENLAVTTTVKLCSPAKYVYNEDGSPVAVEILYPLLYLGVNAPISPLTSQMWATSISVEPGYTGRLHTGFDAAYGPYAGAFYLPWGEFLYLPAALNEWRFVKSDDAGGVQVEWGPAYVGDYFSIQQYASTDYGLTRRFFDLSSPWSHAYLSEGLIVAGSAEISEAFSLINHTPDVKKLSYWKNLF